MSEWLTTLGVLGQHHQASVLVTVAETQGSAPRPAGTKMVVTEDSCSGTIGGGHLEFKAIEIAREMLADTRQIQGASLQRFPLGPSLGQCCGGVVVLLFERICPNDFHIMLFGAGHVGKALVKILSELPCEITWVDSRTDEFPADLPVNVRIEVSEQPEDEVDDAPPGSYLLIMTHNHGLDQAICERALQRDDLAYCGLIGSQTKLKKFQKRLLIQGLSEEALARLICPIGIESITGKHPGEIAVATAAQLLQVRERRAEQWHEHA